MKYECFRKVKIKKIFNKKQKCINCNGILKRKVVYDGYESHTSNIYVNKYSDTNDYHYVCNKCNYKLIDAIDYYYLSGRGGTFSKILANHNIVVHYPKDSGNIILHFVLDDFSTNYISDIYKCDYLPDKNQTIKDFILQHIKAQKFKIFI